MRAASLVGSANINAAIHLHSNQSVQPFVRHSKCKLMGGTHFAYLQFRRHNVANKAMKLIQPNCRMQFAAEDVEFILSVLGAKTGDSDCLVKLLGDEESRDQILD